MQKNENVLYFQKAGGVKTCFERETAKTASSIKEYWLLCRSMPLTIVSRSAESAQVLHGKILCYRPNFKHFDLFK